MVAIPDFSVYRRTFTVTEQLAADDPRAETFIERARASAVSDGFVIDDETRAGVQTKPDGSIVVELKVTPRAGEAVEVRET